jgi:hypothetical protein
MSGGEWAYWASEAPHQAWMANAYNAWLVPDANSIRGSAVYVRQKRAKCGCAFAHLKLVIGRHGTALSSL